MSSREKRKKTMINNNAYDDGSLTAAFGKYQRERQNQFYRDMREDLLEETRKLID